MSILSSDPMAQACEPLGKYYEVRSKVAAGGICRNTMISHVSNIPILPDVKIEALADLINKTLELEAEDYINRWHTREREGEAKIEIKWTRHVFDRRQKIVRVHVNERQWMAISISKREMSHERIK